MWRDTLYILTDHQILESIWHKRRDFIWCLGTQTRNIRQEDFIFKSLCSSLGEGEQKHISDLSESEIHFSKGWISGRKHWIQGKNFVHASQEDILFQLKDHKITRTSKIWKNIHSIGGKKDISCHFRKKNQQD